MFVHLSAVICRPIVIVYYHNGHAYFPNSCLPHLIRFLLMCLVSSDDHRVGGSKLAPWPARLTTPPPRLADFGYSSEFFLRDTVNKNLYYLK